MPYLELQRSVASHVAQPARQAAMAREGWETGACLLYAAHRLLRLTTLLRRGGMATGLRTGLDALLRGAAEGPDEPGIARVIGARWAEGPAEVARGTLIEAAHRFLDPDALTARQDRDSRALAETIRLALVGLVPILRDVEVRSSGPGAPGLVFAWWGPDGALASPAPDAVPGTTAVILGGEGSVRLGPATAHDRRPRPLLPFPPRGDEAAYETDDGRVFGSDGHPSSVLGVLSPARALGRLLAWELPSSDDALAMAARLADAGLTDSAGEVLLAARLHGAADRSAATMEAAREFVTVHGVSQATTDLDVALIRDLEADEAKRRADDDMKGVADVLLARQQAETGRDKIITLTRLANLLQERLDDRASAAYCLLTALQEDPSDEQVLEALVEIAEAAGIQAENAPKIQELALGAKGVARGRLLAAAARLFRAGGDPLAARDAYLLAVEAGPGNTALLDDAIVATDAAGDVEAGLRLRTLRRDAADDVADRVARTLDLAVRYRDVASRWDLAEAEFHRVLHLNPQQIEAFEALVARRLAEGDRDGAMDLCEKIAAQALDPVARAAILRQLGRLLAEAGEDEAAARALGEALALDPASSQDLDALAHLCERLGWWTRLLAVLRRKAGAEPASARDLLLKMANVALDRLDDPEASLGFLTEAAAKAPHDPEPIRRQRELHERLGLWSEVVRDLERIAAEDEAGRVDALVRLAEVQMTRLSLRERGKATLLRAMEAATGSRVDSIAMRIAELAREDRDRPCEMKALEAAAWVAEDDERRADLFTALGRRALEAPADPAAARAYLDKAVAANPVHAEAVELLARVLLDSGHPERVVPAVEPLARRAAATGDKGAERRLRRLAAEAAAGFGDGESAVAQYRRVLELDPDDDAVKAALGRLLAAAGQDGEAIGLLDAVLASPSALSTAERDELDLLAARCATRLGDHARAVERFDEIWQAHGAEMPLLREMVEAATKAGDARRQAQWLEPLARLEPAGLPRFTVQLRLGDLLRDALNDPKAALGWYRAAAAEDVSNKAALHKALDAAVAAADFAEAKGLLVELLAQEQDGIKQAQFHHAAALLARDNLGDPALTREHLWKAVELNPELEEAIEALENVLVGGDDQEGLARLFGLQARHFRLTGQEDRLLSTLRRLAACYDERLHNLPQAAETLRQVLQAAPRDADTAMRLADVLTRSPGREKDALEAHRRVLALDPTHLPAYRAIRDLCILEGDEDGAWCASGALIVLGHETETDRTAFEARRQPALRLRRDALPPEGFGKWILDEGVDEGIARVLSILYGPMSAMLPFKSPKDLGLSEADLVDPAEKGLFQSMALASSKVLGIPLPRIYRARGRTGLAKAAFSPPALVVGDDAFTVWRGKELRFALGRAVTAFAPGFELAGVLDAPTLRLFLLAALRIAFPESVLPADAEAAGEMAPDLDARLSPTARDELRAVLTEFRRQKRGIDPQAFLEGVDRTASRAGLFMANDLEVASRYLRDDSIFLSDLEFGDRLVDLTAWAVSPRCAELRKTMLQP